MLMFGGLVAFIVIWAMLLRWVARGTSRVYERAPVAACLGVADEVWWVELERVTRFDLESSPHEIMRASIEIVYPWTGGMYMPPTGKAMTLVQARLVEPAVSKMDSINGWPRLCTKNVDDKEDDRGHHES